MNTDIERRRHISKDHLKTSQYTLSLLQHAYKYGMIDQNALNNIQIQIMLLLKDLILKFTNGDSTSVKTETAEGLLNSLYYAIDAYTAGIEDAWDALMLLKSSRMEEIYQKGIAVISSCVDQAKILYKRLSGERLDFGTEAYENLFEDLSGFFGQYSILFGGHETNASFDYPLLFDDFDSRGILYVRQYLEKLDLETRFIRLFPKEEVVKLLRNHGRQNRIHYSKLMINMFELVLSHALFSVLGGGEAGSLSISGLQCELLERRLTKIGVAGIGLQIHLAFQTVFAVLNIEAQDLTSYILRYEPILVKNISIALENNILSRSVTTENKEPVLGERIILNEGERLSEMEFKALVSEIMACENIHGKKDLIKQRVRSWQDFIDILEADCLFEGEYAALYASLDDMELAVLGNTVLEDELRETTLHVLLSDHEIGFSEEWQYEFVSFLRLASHVRVCSIDRFMRYLEEVKSLEP